MARYKFSFECEFDESYPMSLHTEEARNLVKSCCPSDFGLNEECELLDCRECWIRALEEGVRVDAVENVHVERVG